MNKTELINDILVIDDFIPIDICKRIISIYSIHKNVILPDSDNLLLIHLFKKSFPEEFNYLKNIILIINKLILQKYNQTVYLDFCGLYSKTGGKNNDLFAGNCFLRCPNHGDNQNYLKSQNCSCFYVKYIPNQTPWRNYSSFIFLNNDYKGGEISISDGPISRIYSKNIENKIGRLVIFPSNFNYYQEIKPVTNGVFHKMSAFFTLIKEREYLPLK